MLLLFRERCSIYRFVVALWFNIISLRPIDSFHYSDGSNNAQIFNEQLLCYEVESVFELNYTSMRQCFQSNQYHRHHPHYQRNTENVTKTFNHRRCRHPPYYTIQQLGSMPYYLTGSSRNIAFFFSFTTAMALIHYLNHYIFIFSMPISVASHIFISNEYESRC